MCNAMTHPAEREVKMIEGSMEKERGGKFGCEHRRLGKFDLYITRTINQKTFSFAEQFGVRNKVIDDDCRNT